MSLLSSHHHVLEAEGRTAVDCSSVLRNVLSKSTFRLVVVTRLVIGWWLVIIRLVVMTSFEGDD